MSDLWLMLKVGLAGVAAWFTAHFWGPEAAYAALVWATMFDVALGIGIAAGRREVVSSTMREGMVRKCVQLLLPLLGQALEPFAASKGAPMDLSDLIATGLLLIELTSILEHLATLGIRVPALSRLLAAVSGKLGEAAPDGRGDERGGRQS